MHVKEFIKSLSAENEGFFANQPAKAKSYWITKLSQEEAIIALRTRYWNEYVGFEVIARFMLRVDNPHLKMLVGRQVGDEAKHAFYVKKRLEELGGDVGQPMPEQLEFYNALDNFKFAEEFFTAQQFTVETQSIKRNEQALINLDQKTADMFKKHINTDEIFHARLGYLGMLHYCITEEAQQRALAAARLIREKHVAMSLANSNLLALAANNQEIR